MLIRKATEADLYSLPAIEEDAALAFDSIGYGFCAGLPGQSLDSLRDTMHEGALLVAEEGDGSLAGFAQLWREAPAAHLRELDVRRSCQKRGIGKALMEAAEDWARSAGLEMITLTTFRDVPWNAPWYARLGFEVVDTSVLPPRLFERLAPELALDSEEYPRVTMRKCL